MLQQVNVCLSRAAQDSHLAGKSRVYGWLAVCCCLVGCAVTQVNWEDGPQVTRMFCVRECAFWNNFYEFLSKPKNTRVTKNRRDGGEGPWCVSVSAGCLFCWSLRRLSRSVPVARNPAGSCLRVVLVALGGGTKRVSRPPLFLTALLHRGGHFERSVDFFRPTPAAPPALQGAKKSCFIIKLLIEDCGITKFCLAVCWKSSYVMT